MIKFFSELYNVLFSCKEYAKRFSHNLDRPLSRGEAIKLKIHHIICQRCRVASEQVSKLGEITEEYLNKPSDQGPSLPKDFSQRLKDKLRNE
jgi:hypothetical protein